MATNDHYGEEPELCRACRLAGEDLLEQYPSWATFERAHDDLTARCVANHQRRAEGGGA